MSISSGSGGASGMGASSSSSDASAMAHPTGSSGAGSGSMCSEKSSSWAWSAAASATASRNSALLPARKRCHPVVHALFSSQRVRDCASCPFGRRLAPPCFVHGQAFEGAIEDGAGKSGTRLRLDAALEAAEDGHVAGLQVRSASWRDEAQYDVWGKRPSWRPGWLRWRGCWPCPREGSTIVLLCLGSSRRPDWQRAAGSWSS